MLVIEQVSARAEAVVKQLETLAYSKNFALASYYKGYIEAMITVMETAGSTWTTRIENAMNLVGKDKPTAEMPVPQFPQGFSDLMQAANPVTAPAPLAGAIPVFPAVEVVGGGGA